MSDVRPVDDRPTDRNPELGGPASARWGRVREVAGCAGGYDQATATTGPTEAGRRTDAPVADDRRRARARRAAGRHDHGEEVLQYPSLAVLAQRYGVSRTLLWKFTRKKRCYERRKEAQAMVQARTDAKVIEKVANARAAATSDVAGIVDTFISRFRTALDKGEVRVDSASDLDRLVRLRELISGNADSRGEVLGQLTLEAIQVRHRRLRGQNR